jgi:fumarate hydratase class II
MGQQYRIEKDSMGEVRVRADALWGSQTQRAIENFKVLERQPYPAFVWSFALIKRAAAEVNRDLGLLPSAIADAIARAAQEIIDGEHADQFVVDPFQAGAGTSHHMNINEVIASRANQILGYRLDDADKPVKANDHVNMAQSTNDTVPAAIRLGALWRLDELLAVVDSLADALAEKGRQFDDVVKSGRTHLQDAVPVRLGQEFEAYAVAVRYDRERIAAAGDRLRRIGIGGTATGTGINAHGEYHERMVRRLSELTGWELRSSGNIFEAVQNLADAVDFSAALRTLAVTLTRICNDLRLLASGPSSGFDEIRFSPAQPGSSIMPGKVNPVFAEMLNMACFHVMGCDLTVMLAGQAGQLEVNVMMPVLAHNLFEAMYVFIPAINLFSEQGVKLIEANRRKAAGTVAKNVVLATALNPVVGYLKAAEIAKEAHERDMTIREVVIERGILTPEKADEVLDARAMTEGGIRGAESDKQGGGA